MDLGIAGWSSARPHGVDVEDRIAPHADVPATEHCVGRDPMSRAIR